MLFEPFSPDNIADLDGEVAGNGGNLTQTYEYLNQMPTADYNMDITSTQSGSFNMVVQDADGTEVLDRSLVKGQGDVSASGVTSAGTAGTWRVIITLTNFNGDGSFSLSEGNYSQQALLHGWFPPHEKTNHLAASFLIR